MGLFDCLIRAFGKQRAMDIVVMVLDGGFGSEECFTSLYDLCDSFTVVFRPELIGRCRLGKIVTEK